MRIRLDYGLEDLLSDTGYDSLQFIRIYVRSLDDSG